MTFSNVEIPQNMENEKIILGIDPGTMVMGYGVIKEVGKNMELLTMGVIN